MSRYGWMALSAALLLIAWSLIGSPTPLGQAQAQTDAPYGLTTRTLVRGLTFPFGDAADSELRLVRAFPAVNFSAPLYLTARPGDDSEFYVVSRRGFIDRFPNNPAATNAQKTSFIDLSARVTPHAGEEGLLGLAFHPDYASNGYFYVYYTANYDLNNPSNPENPRRSVLSRFRRSLGNPAVGDPGSEEILLTFLQPFANHNGGCLQFGPDGKLYIASGDGGSGNDPFNNAQNLGTVLGKLLRLNDDGSIPSDNPFVSTPGARGEIWAYGLRNPWRFSFDRGNGRLWLGDVGQGQVEEVDVIAKGGNYGWRVYEGNRSNGNLNPDNLPPTAFDRPVFTYNHSGTALVTGESITGGYVYRGTALPTLTGQYLFADFINSRVWALAQDNGVVSGVRPIGNVPNPASFGQDNAGNVYVVSFDGYIYKFEPNPAPSDNGFPQQLSETGLFSDLASLTPAAGLIEYGLNAPFWSDGTIKRRWIALAGRSQIRFRAQNAWGWTRRSIIVKHFEIDLANGTRKRLETRVLINGDAGWRGYTYRWNEAGTNANLLTTAATVELEVADATSPTGARTQLYEFPSRGACLNCHNSAAGYILGLRTQQLNRDFLYPNGVTDNQLRAMNHIGLFSVAPGAPPVGDPASYSRLADPGDTAASLRDRARAYLDSNCSQCHRPNGPTPVTLDLRSVVGRGGLRAINVVPSSGNLGVANARIIRPGNKAQSVLWLRMNRLDENRMPPIASHVIDPTGVEVVGQWIDAGAP